jgi:hypothetical protein
MAKSIYQTDVRTPEHIPTGTLVATVAEEFRPIGRRRRQMFFSFFLSRANFVFSQIHPTVLHI